MTTKAFVLDASTALSLLLPDEHSSHAEKIYRLIESNAALYVPRHWLFEVLNGLLMSERRGRLSQPETATALAQVQTMTLITIEENDSLKNTLALARQYQLTIYDAAYLELAMRLSSPLATADKALIKAAKAVGVGVI